jgi:hypothetical protein
VSYLGQFVWFSSSVCLFSWSGECWLNVRYCTFYFVQYRKQTFFVLYIFLNFVLGHNWKEKALILFGLDFKLLFYFWDRVSKPRLTLNSWSSCLRVPSTWITGINCHAQFLSFFRQDKNSLGLIFLHYDGKLFCTLNSLEIWDFLLCLLGTGIIALFSPVLLSDSFHDSFLTCMYWSVTHQRFD